MKVSEKQIMLSINEFKKHLSIQDKPSKPDITKKNIEKLKKLLEEIPEVRQSKVKDLNKAILKKKYNVSSEKVAKKLIGRVITDHLP